jgi:hypothetical protein
MRAMTTRRMVIGKLGSLALWAAIAADPCLTMAICKSTFVVVGYLIVLFNDDFHNCTSDASSARGQVAVCQGKPIRPDCTDSLPRPQLQSRMQGKCVVIKSAFAFLHCSFAQSVLKNGYYLLSLGSSSRWRLTRLAAAWSLTYQDGRNQ